MPSGLRSSARAPRVISARAPRPRNSSWNLATGPSYTITNPTNGSLHSVACTSAVPCDKANLNTAYTGNSPAYPTGDSNSFMADVISLDSNRSEEHTSELQSLAYLVCRLLLEKKKT